LTMTRRTMNQ